MPEAVFAVPGDIATPTGGYIYDRRVMALLPARGVRVYHLELPASFPAPTDADLDRTERLFAASPPEAVLVIDGLAYGAIPAERVARFARPVIALVHHPLGLETGLTEARQQALIASEKAALALARAVIVAGPGMAEPVRALFGVPPSIIACAEPGCDPAPRARGGGAPLHILSVGAVVPRKGHDVLARALARIKERPWRATIVGALDRAADHVASLRAEIARLGLSGRVTLAGALDADGLAHAYDGADLFVSASWFEGYGMVLTEAMAHGIALVASTGGAAEATVPESVALKAPPGDDAALALAIGRLLDDAPLRRRLADAAFAHAQSRPRWTDTADRVAAVIARVAREAGGA